jgi:hypothetical protein
MFVRPYTCFISESATQDRKVCTYNVTPWRFRAMFIPSRLSYQPNTVSLEDSAFMSIKCRRQR